MNAVNRLIYNRLVVGQSVGLPDIGALVVSQSEAKVSNGKVTAPERSVKFTPSSEGIDSVVDILVGEGKVFTDEAQEIYDEWRAKFVKGDGSIEFEAAGRLNDGQLELSEELDGEMNPFGRNKNHKGKTTKKKRCRYCWLWWLVGVIALLAIAVVILCATDRWETLKAKIFYTTKVVMVESIMIDVDAAETDNSDVAGADNIDEQTQVVSEAVAPKYYLVAGIFGVVDNADRFIEENKFGSVDYQKIPYKEMTAVSIYSSVSYEEVRKVKERFKAVDPKLWITRQ